MKSFNSKIIAKSSALLALTIFCASAQFSNSAHAALVNMLWRTIDNPGNAADPYQPLQTFDALESSNNPNSYAFGATGNDYVYRIGRNEVTNAQYITYLNAVDPGGAIPYGIWDSKMEDDGGNLNGAVGGIVRNTSNPNGSIYELRDANRANNPVAYVSYWDTLRFANWMHNGQGVATNAGETTALLQTGAYTLAGSLEIPTNASTVSRNSGANVFLPNENEWYKAAFYDFGAASYFDYATSSNSLPVSENPSLLGSNSANYAYYDSNTNDWYYAIDGSAWSTNFGPDQNTNFLTNVGAYSNSDSPFGTFDQNGNVNEWAEGVAAFDISGNQAIWGGGWDTIYNEYLSAHWRTGASPEFTSYQLGFRVASLLQANPPGGGGGGVPEPSTLLLAAVGMLALVRKQRRS